MGQAGAILYSTVTTSLPVVMTHANVQGSEAPTVATRVAGCFYLHGSGRSYLIIIISRGPIIIAPTC